MKKLFIYIIILSSINFATASSCKEDLQSLLLKSRRNTFIREKQLYLNPSDLREINHLWSQGQNDISEKISKSYRIYQNARLRGFSEIEKKKYLRKMNSINLIEHKIEGEKIVANGETISYPSSIKGTALLYGIISHEAEHRLQTGLYLNVGRFERLHIAKILADIFFFVDTKFELEKGAMSAEWEFLHHLPKEAITESLEILKNSNIEQSYKNVFSDMLQNIHFSKNEYLRKQYSIGRYSKEAISKSRIAPSALALLTTVTFFVAINRLIED